jgi:hypothetical protein
MYTYMCCLSYLAMLQLMPDGVGSDQGRQTGHHGARRSLRDVGLCWAGFSSRETVSANLGKKPWRATACMLLCVGGILHVVMENEEGAAVGSRRTYT